MKTKRKIFWLTTLVMISLATFIGACRKDKYIPLDTVCPVVKSTDPANMAINVPLTQVITVTFNEKMDPSTINSSSFIVTGSVVAGTVSYNGSTASFTPASPLMPNHTYTGRVTTAVKDLNGLALQTDFVWTFSTGAFIVPQVISTDPADKDTGVYLNKIVSANFNMLMDPSTFNSATFNVKEGSVMVPGTISYSGTTVYFKPAANLKLNTLYTATITTGVKAVSGTPLPNNYIWTFTTGKIAAPTVIFTDPTNNSTGVALDKTISAAFSEAMDPASINASTFTLRNGSINVSGVVSYSGTLASFKPSVDLLPGTVYTATITKGAKNPSGTTLANDYIWTFTTLGTLAPLVISTDPANNATGVVLNKIITATFNGAMDPSTINSLTFTLKQGTTPIAGTVSYNGNTASFKPSVNLLPGTIYTATITNGVKNSAGTSMVNDYVWTFTTGTTAAPTVISTDPTNNALGVPLNKVIRATFSEPMDPLTINSGTFTLKQGNTPISGVISYSGNTASFTPSINLLPGKLYTATITTGAKNTSGIALANDYVWTFTTLGGTVPTVMSTDPPNNATGVFLNKVITATFSEPMDPSTINTNTFTLKDGTTPVSGIVTYSGSTASFTPSVNLLPGKIYTATITTGAKSLNGTPLASDYIWSFTTINGAGPTVISTDPSNNATGVPLNKVIKATFSEPMDPLTINGSTFTVKQGATPVSGIVTYSGSTASFTPTSNLMSGTTYTATITTGAKNLAGIPLANNYVWNFSTIPPGGGPNVDLKSVGRFGIIAGVGVANNAGFSVINNMDVGIYPGVRSSVTGFPPAIIVNGAIYASDDASPPGVAAMLAQAKQDLTDAYLFAEGATSPAPTTVSGDQGGKTLAPGIYKSTSTLSVAGGDLTLDAQGDPNAVWIFQVASAFTTVGGSGGNIILSGGAQAKNIFWQTGSSATIGSYTSFKGNVLALTSITMGAYATATGRMLARNGSVVMTSTNIINKP